MNIDWSKAPEGATHYGAATYPNGTADWCEAFYKKVGGCWMICFPTSHDWHGDASRNPDWNERFATLIERPAASSGEGVSQIELAKVLISLSADIRQPINPSQAAWMAAQLEELGYRKFEIVEEDV